MSVELEAHGVDCGYGSRIVLENFDLRVKDGTLLALLGPNGAGKTTALRALARLLRPRRGRVTLDGDEIWSLSGREFCRRVAYAPQFHEVEWGLTVEETVALGRAPHRGWLLPYSTNDRQAIERVMEQLALITLRRRRVDTLSGGEKRRVLLARTLVQEPRILLLDEPTAHLDLRYQVEILDLLKHLAHERRLAVVVSLHDLNQAALWADEAALLKDGRLLVQDTVGEVLTAQRLGNTYEVEVDVVPAPGGGRSLVVPALRGVK